MFPPLRLCFVDATGVFAGVEKVNLVSHRRNDNRGDANVMEDCSAYRVFNLLSPHRLRLRPLRITCMDTEVRLDEKAHRRNPTRTEGCVARGAGRGPGSIDLGVPVRDR
jgi:hypothetical protein